MWNEFQLFFTETLAAAHRFSPVSPETTEINSVKEMLKVLTHKIDHTQEENDFLKDTLDSLVSQKIMDAAPSTLLQKRS